MKRCALCGDPATEVYKSPSENGAKTPVCHRCIAFLTAPTSLVSQAISLAPLQEYPCPKMVNKRCPPGCEDCGFL
jgi:hypothetical protein